MPSRKNQHFVPQFYLRHYSADKKNVSLFLKKDERLLNCVPIKTQCSKDYFYPDLQYEESLGKIEEQCQRIINRVVGGYTSSFSKAELFWLRAFVVLQRNRTEHEAQILLKSFGEMRDYFESLGMTKEVRREVEGFPNTEKEAVELMTYLFKTGMDMTADIKCKILHYQGKGAFLTSDDPVVMYNPFLENHGKPNYGLAAIGLLLLLPLSDSYAVVLYDGNTYKIGNRKELVVSFDSIQDLYWMNLLTFLNANNAIYFKPGTHDILSFLGLTQRAKAIGQTKQTRFETFLAEDGQSELLHSYGQNFYIGAKFSFIKMLDKAKGFKLGDTISVTDYSRPYCNALYMSSFPDPPVQSMRFRPKQL